MHMRRDEIGIFDDTLHKYQRALERLMNFEVRVSDSSRLRLYERKLDRILQQQGDLLALSEMEAYQTLFAFREMDEICFIIDSFSNTPSSGELERLQCLPGGTENPDNESTTRARDAQFELYLRAMFALADIQIEMGSPDLILKDGEIVFPIEAKRPGSSSRFDDRLRGAINQIQRCESSGVVVISLDQVIRPHGGYLGIRTPDSIALATYSLVEGYLRENSARIAARLRGKSKVAALLFVLRVPARVTATNLTVLGTNIHTVPVAEEGQSSFTIVQALLNIIERVHRSGQL